MAEFVARYGFLPEPDFPWIMFTAMADRLAAFDAQELLSAIAGNVSAAASGPFGSKDAGRRLKRQLRDLEAIAYPDEEPASPRRGRTPLNRDAD